MFALESALINLCEPAADDFADGEVKAGFLALHIKVQSAPSADDEHPPSLSIGPLLYRCRSLAQLVGRRIVLADGYVEDREEHIATLYVHEHETLGRTVIEIVRADDATAEIRIDAVSPDTEFYDGRAEPGRVHVTAECAFCPTLRL